MLAYAAIYENVIREKSSSGGIFSLLASQFDVVYGVAMTKDNYECEVVRMEGDISPLRGSKYFQAKVGESFKLVKKDLEEGKIVLYSGTGCQINGLKLFLRKDYSNLFLVDVICHGTPSPKLWREYVKYYERKYGKLEYVNFRCKVDGWKNFGMQKNELYISKDDDWFMQMFLRDYCLRPSCYECHAKKYKMADITIADFWGIENVAPEMNDDRGTSLVIIRSDKGKKMFDSVKSDLRWKEVSYGDAVKGNPSEYSSVKRPVQRDYFFRDLNRYGFKRTAKKYVDESFSIKRKIKSAIKMIFDRIRFWGYK